MGGSDWPGRFPQSEPSWTTLTRATGSFGFIVRFGQIIACDDRAASSCTPGEVHVCLLAACFRPSVGGRRRIVETRRWAYYSSRAGSRASEPAEYPGLALAGPEQGKSVAPAHLAERRRGHAGRRACLASPEANAMPVQDLSFLKDANAGPAFTDTVRFSQRRVPTPSRERVPR